MFLSLLSFALKMVLLFFFSRLFSFREAFYDCPELKSFYVKRKQKYCEVEMFYCAFYLHRKSFYLNNTFFLTFATSVKRTVKRMRAF